VEAPGVALDQRGLTDPARSRAFLVKLLMQRTFDVFIDSAGLHSSAPNSTEFLEGLWRRREYVPAARVVADVV